MDTLKVALIVNIGAIAIALLTAFKIALDNAGSRNLALATGTLAGAIVLFLIQLKFELQPSSSRDHISAEFTIDRAQPAIRQWIYSESSGSRLGRETGASSWLAANKPIAFEQDREKMTLDLTLFSLMSFFATSEFDWQLKKVTYSGKASGTLTLTEPISKAEECASFSKEDLQSRLTTTGNMFAEAPLFVTSGRLCLPPRSVIEASANSLVVRNPVCQMSWRIKPSGTVSHMKPRTGGEVPQLPNGGSQYETRLVGLDVEITYFALRAQSADREKYRDWCSRVVQDAHEWFEN